MANRINCCVGKFVSYKLCAETLLQYHLSRGDVGSATTLFDLALLHFLQIQKAITATMIMINTIAAVMIPAVMPSDDGPALQHE